MSPSTTLKLRLTIQQNHLEIWLETQGGATHTYLVVCVPKMLPCDSEAGPGLHKRQRQRQPHLRGHSYEAGAMCSNFPKGSQTEPPGLSCHQSLQPSIQDSWISLPSNAMFSPFR